jgi:hypothetical protein
VLSDVPDVGADPEAALFSRLSLWFDLRKNGFVTPFEEPEPTRSDCHGWGAHPLFHYHATLLGVRPGSPGFARVEIRPHLGKLTALRGSVAHLRGAIEVNLTREGKGIRGVVRLPAGLHGNFVWRGVRVALHPGDNLIEGTAA